jgi:hypothetical protein
MLIDLLPPIAACFACRNIPKPNPPILQTPMSMFDLDYLVRNLRLEYEWLQFVSLTNEVLDVETVSWSAYHSSKGRGNRLATTYCCMFCMQKHTSVSFLMGARCYKVGIDSFVADTFRGCDTVSAFVGKGKKTAWQGLECV